MTSEITVFDFVNQILQGNSKGKQIELNEETESIYNQYVINKALSRYKDCLFQVNEMNLYSNLSNKMSYDFYLNSIRKYRRPFVEWNKKETDDSIEAISKFFGYSHRKAKEVLKLISEEQLKLIIENINIGGIKNE